MSLNNISLPSQLLANLYQQVLISGTENSTATAMPAKKTIPFLGKNGKNILILINQPNAPFLPDEELSFLTKILMACGLSLMDVAIVNINKLQPLIVAELLLQTTPQFIIFFQVDPTLFGFSSAPLFVVKKEEGRMYVAAPALNEIEKTKEAKSSLWIALKNMFGI